MNEADDLERTGRFRMQPISGYVEGKRFATSLADAIRWGRGMQRFSNPRPFRVASVTFPASLLREFRYYAQYDGIGPAIFVLVDRLSPLNRAGRITVFATIYEVEELP